MNNADRLEYITCLTVLVMPELLHKILEQKRYLKTYIVFVMKDSIKILVKKLDHPW